MNSKYIIRWMDKKDPSTIYVDEHSVFYDGIKDNKDNQLYTKLASKKCSQCNSKGYNLIDNLDGRIYMYACACVQHKLNKVG